MKPLAVCLALIGPAANGAAAAALPVAADARSVVSLLETGGFVAIHDLERRHGLWTAEGTTADGLPVYLLVDEVQQVVDAIGAGGEGSVSLSELPRLLAAQGYQDLREIEFDEGLWAVEASNRAGVRVDLLVHGRSGRVLAEAPYGKPRADAGLLSAAQVLARLQSLGYSDAVVLQFDDGVWELAARRPGGYRVELDVDARSGLILREWREEEHDGGTGYLSAAEVSARLAALGYTQIRPIKIDDGVWEVMARNPRGQRVEVYVDARTGVILHEERD